MVSTSKAGAIVQGRKDADSGKAAVLLSSANWDIHLRRISEVCSAGAKQSIAWQTPPFAQYRILLDDEASELRRSNIDYYVFAERIEDFVGPFQILDSSLVEEIRNRFGDYLAD